VARKCCQISVDGYSRKLAMVTIGRLSIAATRKIPGFHKCARRGKLADREFTLLSGKLPACEQDVTRQKMIWLESWFQRYTWPGQWQTPQRKQDINEL